MAIFQPVQAACKSSVKQVYVAEGASGRMRVLFISAAVAEGRILHQGYLLWLHCGEIPRAVFTLSFGQILPCSHRKIHFIPSVYHHWRI